MAREGEGDREGEREKTRARGMSPVCASIDIIPLRRDKIELKSKTGYYLSAKTFCLGWETAAATVLRSDSCGDAGFPPGASTLRFSKRRQRRQRTKEIISDWIGDRKIGGIIIGFARIVEKALDADKN